MAFNRSLGIDIGTDSIKIVELVRPRGKDKKNVVVQNILEAPIEAPVDAPAEARNAAITQTIRDLIKKNRIQTKYAVFSLPGQIAFTRRIPLPVTSPERLERIIRFEARQQIPFPPEQTAMQYQVFEHPDGENVDILLVAIRKDIVNDYMQIINRCNVQPIMISISSFALFNYHIFNNRGPLSLLQKEAEPDKKKKKKKKKKGKLKLSLGKKKKGEEPEAGDEEETENEELEQPQDAFSFDDMEEIKAYFNIGSSTFDLAIHRQQSKEDTLGFVRSVPFAGNEITKAIQEKLKISSFSEADKIKCTATQIEIPGFEDEGSDVTYNKEACQAIVKPVNRIVSELRRSLDFYISQPDGVAVDSLEISGGTAGLPNLTTYIEEKLGLPAQVNEDKPNEEYVEFGKEAPSEFSKYLVAFGLAVTGLEESKIQINFLPREQQVNLEIKKKYIQLGFMVILLVCILGIASQIGGVNVRNYKNAAKDMNQQMLLISKKEENINTIEKSREEINDKFRKVGLAVPKKQDYWFNVYLTLLNEKPPAVIFTEIKFSGLGEITIKGISQVQNSIPEFTTKLQESAENEDSYIKSASLKDVKERMDPDLQRRVNYYEIVIGLKEKSTRYQTPAPDPVVSGGPDGAAPGARGPRVGQPPGARGVRGAQNPAARGRGAPPNRREERKVNVGRI